MDSPRESFYSSIMFFSTAGELLLCVSPRLLFLIRKEQYSSLHLKLHLHHRRTFLNTMVLFLFLKSKNMRRKNSYVAIMILSATDLTVVTIVIQLCFYLRQSLKLWAHGACLYSICFNIVSKTTPSIIVSNFTHHYEYWAYIVIVNPIFHRTTVSKRKIILTFGILGCIFFICAAKIWT